MGLLDDAIREHLELKRRSGADPGAIAQAEHEALDPIFPAEASATADDGASPDGAAAYSPSEDALEVAPPPEAQAAVPDAAGSPDEQCLPATDDADFSNVGQETAEIDMQAVLEEDLRGQDAAPMTAATSRPVRAVSARPAQQDDVDWQAPERSDQPAPPEEIPGQERLSFE